MTEQSKPIRDTIFVEGEYIILRPHLGEFDMQPRGIFYNNSMFAQFPDVDTIQITLKELAPENESTLTEKLRQAYKDYKARHAFYLKHFLDYFNAAAELLAIEHTFHELIRDPKNDTYIKNLTGLPSKTKGDELFDKVMIKIQKDRFLEESVERWKQSEPFNSTYQATIHSEAFHITLEGELRRLAEWLCGEAANDILPFMHVGENGEISCNNREINRIFIDNAARMIVGDQAISDTIHAMREHVGHHYEMSEQGKTCLNRIEEAIHSVDDEDIKALMRAMFDKPEQRIFISANENVDSFKPNMVDKTRTLGMVSQGDIFLRSLPKTAEECLQNEGANKHYFVGYLGKLPIATKQHKNIAKTICEEALHAAMPILFNNYHDKYIPSPSDRASMCRLGRAITADANHLDKTNTPAWNNLSLHRYAPLNADKNKQVDMHALSNDHWQEIEIEAPVKVMVIAATEGWDRARDVAPVLTQYVEDVILPRAREYMAGHGNPAALVAGHSTALPTMVQAGGPVIRYN